VRRFLIQWTLPLAAAFALHAQSWRLDSLTGLQPSRVKAEAATYHGRPAVRLTDIAGPGAAETTMAMLDGSDFEDGTIEAEVAGLPRSGSFEGARGFIGIAFRVTDPTHFECFYIRPTNGRADDQLRRNHATQYIAQPDFPWNRLRQESPGVYESYADLAAGEWTRIKIVVSGVRAQLFVNGADQPCLVVNDLKHGKSRGKVALWVGSDTDGYFSNLAVRK
jgi:hypothetical protein